MTQLYEHIILWLYNIQLVEETFRNIIMVDWRTAFLYFKSLMKFQSFLSLFIEKSSFWLSMWLVNSRIGSSVFSWSAIFFSNEIADNFAKPSNEPATLNELEETHNFVLAYKVTHNFIPRFLYGDLYCRKNWISVGNSYFRSLRKGNIHLSNRQCYLFLFFCNPLFRLCQLECFVFTFAN